MNGWRLDAVLNSPIISLLPYLYLSNTHLEKSIKGMLLGAQGSCGIPLREYQSDWLRIAGRNKAKIFSFG